VFSFIVTIRALNGACGDRKRLEAISRGNFGVRDLSLERHRETSRVIGARVQVGERAEKKVCVE
jgi:hypothetical protein